MKIWKLVAVTMLALAPAAFGAVQLNFVVDPAPGNKINNVAGSTFVMDVVIVNTGLPADAIANGATGVNGVDLWLQTNAAGASNVQLTARAITANTQLTDTYNTDAQLGLPITLTTTASAKDLGAFADVIPDGDIGNTGTAGVVWAQLTFHVVNTVQPGTAIVSTAGLTSWFADDFNNYPLDAASHTSFIITPEPASMLLLAAGSLLFARRRRA